jgi:hypothetical protein
MVANFFGWRTLSTEVWGAYVNAGPSADSPPIRRITRASELTRRHDHGPFTETTRVDHDPSKIASATVIPAGAGGESVRLRGGTHLLTTRLILGAPADAA